MAVVSQNLFALAQFLSLQRNEQRGAQRRQIDTKVDLHSFAAQRAITMDGES